MPANDDPRNAPSYRVVKAIVIILGILIVLALGALIWGFIGDFSGHGAGGPPLDQNVSLPTGSKIVQLQTTTTGRIVMTVQTPGGAEVDIFDSENGALVSRIHMRNKP
jgi:hypothetical protein